MFYNYEKLPKRGRKSNSKLCWLSKIAYLNNVKKV